MPGNNELRVALAQINPCLGDFSANRKKIVEYCLRAKEKRCDLVVFPEFALFGYHPADLLERKSIVEQQLKEFNRLCKSIPKDLVVIVGMVSKNLIKKGKRFCNSAVVIRQGKLLFSASKQLLPTYDVFDESRHIERGRLGDGIVKVNGKKILLTICEDIWAWGHDLLPNYYTDNPIKKIRNKNVDLVVNLSASPFTLEKKLQRRLVVEKTAKYLKAPLVYVNMVGGQDELVFDGGSFVTDARGKMLAESAYFAEDLNVVDFNTGEGGFREQEISEIESIRQAIVVGIGDFVEKIGLSKIHLGLSGGIDSAVVACLAADAVGGGRLTCVAMPGPYSTKKSLRLAKKLSENLGANWHEIPIVKTYETMTEEFKALWPKLKFGLVHENLQARLRGTYLMSVANCENSLLLTTGNKSEYATGYTTLYGDMCGGLAPIADLVKGQVYDLANYYNQHTEIIPQEVIDRPPSAELAPNQKDQDSLPPYTKLDRSVRRLVEQQLPPRGDLDQWVLKSLMRSEFKRWQAAPIIKITQHAFGRGRRFPIAHKAIY